MFLTLSQNHWFDSRLKTKLHIGQLSLIMLAIILTGVRINTIQGATARSDTIAIVMGVKSIVVFSYQMLTTHIDQLRKWASLKAFMMLNCMEILFWFVVVIVGFMGVSSRCMGIACALGVLIGLMALVLTLLATWVTLISILDYRYSRSYGTNRGDPTIPASGHK